MKPVIALAAIVAAAGLAGPVAAQGSYPDRPITIVVPFSPGGINDRLARVIAEPMSAKLGQPVVVENRPGGGSQIGIASVANSEPDGYTILFGSSDGMTLTPALNSTLPYDVSTDFAYIGIVRNESGHAITIAPNLEVEDFHGLLELGRSDAGLNYGSSGIGSVPHLGAILLTNAEGLNTTHVPYPGMADAVTALLASQVDLVFITPTTVAPHKAAGTLGVVAQTGLERHPQLSDVPTTAELGVEEMLAIDSWSGLAVPADTDPEIVARLSNVLAETLEDPAIVQTFTDLGVTASPMRSEPFTTFVADQLEKWTQAAIDNDLRQ